jgi:ketosteroid isomerase-like protein
MPDRSETVEVFNRLVAAINEQNVSAIACLLSPDHVFVDALGNRLQGADAMEAAWRNYFVMCPDYWIRPEQIMAEGDTALAAGEAGGTIDGQPWRTPAAWKAVVLGGQIAQWRVFADNKPTYEILARRQKK